MIFGGKYAHCFEIKKKKKMEKDKKMSFNIFYPFHGNFKD